MFRIKGSSASGALTRHFGSTVFVGSKLPAMMALALMLQLVLIIGLPQVARAAGVRCVNFSDPSCTATDATISAAITNAAAGDTIKVGAGTYNGNININKSLTLQGANVGVAGNATRASESIISATGLGSNLGTRVTISANNVTFDGFRINGPGAGNGVSVGSVSGASVTNNLIVGVGLTGIIAGGTNTSITNNSITGAGLIGINANGTTPTVSNNFVSNKTTGISAPGAATITNNEVTTNITGINAGGTSSVSGNNAHSNTTGIGITTGSAATVSGNTIDSNGTGLTTGGSNGVHITGNTISNNTLSGINNVIIATSNLTIDGNTFANNANQNIFLNLVTTFSIINNTALNSPGNLASLALSSGGTISGNNYSTSASVSGIVVNGPVSDVNITSNTFNGGTSLLHLINLTGGAGTRSSNFTVHYNRSINHTGSAINIDTNGSGAYNGATLDAENNWWGCNTVPVAPDPVCDLDNIPAGAQGPTIVDYDPWLTLTLTATPPAMVTGFTSALVANTTINSDGVDVSPNSIPNGTSIAFGATNGSVNPATNTTTTGATGSTFTSGVPGPATATATLDSQTVTVDITVLPVPAIGFGSTPPPGSTVQFGGAKAGETVNASITVFETGNQPLTLSNPTLTGPSAADFSLVSPAFPIVLPDGSAPVDIVLACTPSGGVYRYATLTFNTNDPSQPTVSYELFCSVIDSSTHVPADLIAKLRVTPDREFAVTAGNELSYNLTVTNIGPGQARLVYARIPFDANLEAGYTTFSDPKVWVEAIVTDTEHPYIQVRFPVIEPNSTYSATLVMRPKEGAATDATVFTRAQVFWDDDSAGGRVHGSNAVRFDLSATETRNDSDGAIQYFGLSANKIANGGVLDVTGDFFAPNELVTFWYTDKDNNSFALGVAQADSNGVATIAITPSNLAEGDTYVVAGYGNRSGVTGSGVVTITSETSGKARTYKVTSEK